MQIIKFLLYVITMPVRSFWQTRKKSKEDNDIATLIIQITFAVAGVLIIGFLLIQGGAFLINEHIEILIIGCILIWLFSYVKKQMEKNPETPASEQMTADIKELTDQGNKMYPVIRNILYQTLKDMAPSIGAVTPRVMQEIEIPEKHYIIQNNIIFYQLKVSKEDIKCSYNRNDCDTFKDILQNEINKRLETGLFPSFRSEKILDSYGNTYDGINIDLIEDVDSYMIIHVVLYSPYYANYLRNKKMAEEAQRQDSSVPDANWEKN